MKVLICDDNKEFVSSIYEYLSGQEDMEVVGVAYDGNETLRKINELSPDVILLDVIMPELDGVGVMQRLVESKMTNPPAVIVLSAISQDKMIKEAIELGAYCFMLKPFEMELLTRRIRSTYEERMKNNSSVKPLASSNKTQFINVPRTNTPLDAEVEVTNLMHSIGIPANISGHQFLREAILLVIEDRGMIGGITKELYPSVAKKHKTTSTKVERAIRHALEVSWSRGRMDLFEKECGYNTKENRGKPTNGEFIAMAAELIRMKLKQGGALEKML
ncbi:MAG: sporulation transcription factor Spo0A [Clostridia bacterium]|nr:sporulation transcription factor Spo0A [Clostridia bacterium]